jgi:DNA-binding MarR family transcriptional regulator/N-acetylglutamate synthase-like GNAT family acetyltransferase
LTLATIALAVALEQRVEAVRRFNRFYTRRIGILQDGYLHSPFSLAEARVLYELAHTERATATALARLLDLDTGYLSRILGRFLERGLVDRTRSERDAREAWLSLSPPGRAAFEPLDGDARRQIAELLAALSDADQQRLITAFERINTLLGGRPPEAGYVLRAHQPGDMGWVVQRHGALYAEEYGFDTDFEALVASIVARFIQHLDPERERCWIAARDGGGERVGCVFLVKASKTIGKLRLFLVEPDARGLGIGHRLVDECIRFARAAGYRKIHLWTQSNLLAARHIYDQAGFRVVEEEPHHSYSQDLVAETWELRL